MSRNRLFLSTLATTYALMLIASASSVSVLSEFVVVTMNPDRLDVRASNSKRILWSKILDDSEYTKAAVTANAVLIAQNKKNTYLSIISSSDPETGKDRWSRSFPQKFSNLYVRSNKLFSAFINSGGDTYISTSVFKLSTGEDITKIPGQLITESSSQALFDTQDVVFPYDAVSLKYTRYNYESGLKTPLSYKINERGLCGQLSKDASQPGGSEHLTSQFIYAIRKDTCGVFVARFTWTANPTVPPLIYPKSSH